MKETVSPETRHWASPHEYPSMSADWAKPRIHQSRLLQHGTLVVWLRPYRGRQEINFDMLRCHIQISRAKNTR